MVIYDFLAPGEAEHLIELAKPLMQRSKVVGEDNYLSNVRTSSTAFLRRGMDKVVECIEERTVKIHGYPVINIEPFQVNSQILNFTI